ncbi:hypothetical protein SB49_03160 [Sediminicola sp. YIK13]|uniref:hypothetical protein n=1 Tax=Sediminicola sp. YIK13 TaxID=1453352 RepID=UPI000722485D|nr:hypothetical protein [Sediminicola sp. YIK13]ALM06911.1 hypothetical protein SB49_03160 [Sediminicola sp. YIK13]
MTEFAKNEKNNIDEYQKKGYTHSYRFQDGQLVDVNSKIGYLPEDILIVAEHRYEGMSNPSDLSILYVLKTKEGNKGTFLMGYGPTANLEAADFFKEIPRKNNNT